jgi:hypothetical protein
MATTTNSTLKVIRSMNGITPDVTIDEQHQDQLLITEHPVEQGAVIADHAVKLPADVIIQYGWATGGPSNTAQADSFLNDLYAQILAVQSAATLFMVYTGRRIYKSMLLQSVTLTTDKATENALVIRMLCHQIILVTTKTITVSLDPTTQASPQKTLPVASQGSQSLQPAQTFSFPNYLTYLQPRQN